MGFSTDSSRFRRALTRSVRFFPRVAFSRAAALVRSAAAIAAESWRELQPAGDSRAAAGPALETERTAAATAQTAGLAGAAAEFQRELAPAAHGFSGGATAVELQREHRGAARNTSSAGAAAANEAYFVNETPENLVDDTGEQLVAVEL